MTTTSSGRWNEGGRSFGSGPCLVCGATAVTDDLCPTHRAIVEREVPTPLVKLLPPKERVSDAEQ